MALPEASCSAAPCSHSGRGEEGQSPSPSPSSGVCTWGARAQLTKWPGARSASSNVGCLTKGAGSVGLGSSGAPRSEGLAQTPGEPHGGPYFQTRVGQVQGADQGLGNCWGAPACPAHSLGSPRAPLLPGARSPSPLAARLTNPAPFSGHCTPSMPLPHTTPSGLCQTLQPLGRYLKFNPKGSCTCGD